ncbi:MAG: hypothetical protein DYG98_17280 [Haliscomenobacteraceae bacterium CHB4]|nr:hypothetical protein [Saprospiraceae bacterium]MCE7924805.1 hypothetical protein [Haliscomenobacteraceae bacterium CHB4]
MLKTSFRFFAAFSAIYAVFPNALFSQEQLGMRLERYAGIYGATLNPANTAFNPNNWEISLFSADVFFENNYAFLQNTSLPNALRNSDKIISVADTSAENPPARDAIFLDYFDAKKKMRGVGQSRVTGPSFSFRFGENNVIGLVTAFRTHASAYKIPSVLSYRTITDVPVGQTIDIAPTGVQTMAWGEIGLHYSRRNTDRDVYTAFGVTPRLLLGLEGAYARSNSDLQYTDLPGDTVSFGNARWDYALTTGNFTDNSDSVRARVQGAGFGLDIGFVWAMPADDGDSDEDYAWRLGVSLLDAGFMRFGKSAEKHHLEFDTTIAVTNSDFPAADDPHDRIEDASRVFLGDPAASLQGRSFSMGLPMALSVQLDVKAAPHLYVSGLLVQRMKMLKNSLQRPGTLALVPRFEHRWFSFSLPVVLNDWRSFRMGVAARLGFLYLGTDNLGSLFKKEKLTGGDFYVGLKINAFSFGSREGSGLRSSSGGGRGRQKRGKIKCYDF